MFTISAVISQYIKLRQITSLVLIIDNPSLMFFIFYILSTSLVESLAELFGFLMYLDPDQEKQYTVNSKKMSISTIPLPVSAACLLCEVCRTLVVCVFITYRFASTGAKQGPCYNTLKDKPLIMI